MREKIEAKIAEWQQGLEHLHSQRTSLAQQLTEIDVAIERNTGAIIGGRELLQLAQPQQPPADEAAPAATESPTPEPG